MTSEVSRLILHFLYQEKKTQPLERRIRKDSDTNVYLLAPGNLTNINKINTMLFQRAANMTRRSSALISGHMKSMPRKYMHSTATHTSSLLTLTNNHSAVNYDCVARNNTMVSTTYRTKSSKPSFSWEGKRVEVTTPEEFQRRLNRIEVS